MLSPWVEWMWRDPTKNTLLGGVMTEQKIKNKRLYSACVRLEDIYSLIHFPKLLYLSLKYYVINYKLLLSFYFKKVILLFSKNALNWSKVTFIILQNNYISKSIPFIRTAIDYVYIYAFTRCLHCISRHTLYILAVHAFPENQTHDLAVTSAIHYCLNCRNHQFPYNKYLKCNFYIKKI